uniref:Uncharacterized protein n=1 Tax=Rhizophora mucronata TaxID=61149 RepID=A0A2P2JLN1_RHIMU
MKFTSNLLYYPLGPLYLHLVPFLHLMKLWNLCQLNYT